MMEVHYHGTRACPQEVPSSRSQSAPLRSRQWDQAHLLYRRDTVAFIIPHTSLVSNTCCLAFPRKRLPVQVVLLDVFN